MVFISSSSFISIIIVQQKQFYFFISIYHLRNFNSKIPMSSSLFFTNFNQIGNIYQFYRCVIVSNEIRLQKNIISQSKIEESMHTANEKKKAIIKNTFIFHVFGLCRCIALYKSMLIALFDEKDIEIQVFVV